MENSDFGKLHINEIVFLAWILLMVWSIIYGAFSFFSEEAPRQGYSLEEVKRCKKVVSNSFDPDSERFRECADILNSFDADAGAWAAGGDR